MAIAPTAGMTAWVYRRRHGCEHGRPRRKPTISPGGRPVALLTGEILAGLAHPKQTGAFGFDASADSQFIDGNLTRAGSRNSCQHVEIVGEHGGGPPLLDFPSVA